MALEEVHAFYLLRRSCLASQDEFNIKFVYITISAISAVAGILMLLHIGCGKSRKKGALSTSIGRLLRYLVLVQSALDISFHISDILFAADCDAYPLLYLLLAHEDQIFKSRTMAWNIIKEGIGLTSAVWHANMALIIYKFIVLKLSALRLRRSGLSVVLITTGGLSVIRYILYIKLRKGLLGIYLGIILFDLILTPAVVVIMLRWHYLTVKALATSSSEQASSTNPFSMFHSLPTRSDKESNSSRAVEGVSKDSSVVEVQQQQDEEQQQPRQHEQPGSRHIASSTSDPCTVHRSIEEEEGGRTRGDASHHPSSGGITSVAIDTPAANPADFSTDPSLVRSASISERSKTAGIIIRLTRISISVSILWMAIVTINLYIWGAFYFNLGVLNRHVFLFRMVIMRLVGLLDAIILSDRSFKSFSQCAYFHSPLFGIKAKTKDENSRPEDSAFSSMAEGNLPVFRNRSTSSSIPSKAGPSWFFSPSPEEEAPHLIRTLEMINQQSVPARLSKSVEMFVSTYNCGGIDRDEVIEKGLFRLIMSKWIPREGFDIYVVGVQECECLKEFREALQTYLGGPSQYTIYGAEIGDSSIIRTTIAITLCIRTSAVTQGICEIQQGVVNRVNAGVGLGAYRAPNKGMVGLSLRYHDTSIAIVSAHFASDCRGRNRMMHRNQDAIKALRDLSLYFDSDNFDVQNQHHHTIILGDLNYRLSNSSPREVLNFLSHTARAAQAHAQLHRVPTGSNEPINWRTLSYAKVFQPPSTITTTSTRTTFPSLVHNTAVVRGSDVSALSLLGGGAKSDHSSDSLGRLKGRTFPRPQLMSARTSSILNRDTYISEGVDENNDGDSLPSLPLSNSSTVRRKRLNLGGSAFSDGSNELLPPIPLHARRSSSISSFFLHYGPSSILEEDLWEWVLRFDELSRSMRERLVFWGFQENPISFPPSYRWNRALPTPIPAIDDDVETAVAAAPIVQNYHEGGLAGDFTDIEKLEQAYTTSVTDSPALFGPVVSSLARSLSSFRRSDSGSANKATPPSSPSRGASPRTPSYTDRILTHSLPGKAPYLRWGFYESCDLVELSDHRPVVATLSIKVASDVRGFSIMPPSDGPSTTGSAAGGGGSEDDLTRLATPERLLGNPADKALFQITLARPRIRLRGLGVGSIVSPSDAPREAIILFPLQSEDPYMEERKANSLGEAMPSFLPSSHSESTSSLSSSLLHVGWSSFPCRIQTIASLRFSEHLLIKISHRDGQDLGQAVIPIALGLHREGWGGGGSGSKDAVSRSVDLSFSIPLPQEPPAVPMRKSLSALHRVSEGRDGRGAGGGPEGIGDRGKGEGGKHGRQRLRLPLASGGSFKGWLMVDLKVRMKHIN